MLSSVKLIVRIFFSVQMYGNKPNPRTIVVIRWIFRLRHHHSCAFIVSWDANSLSNIAELLCDQITTSTAYKKTFRRQPGRKYAFDL